LLLNLGAGQKPWVKKRTPQKRGKAIWKRAHQIGVFEETSRKDKRPGNLGDSPPFQNFGRGVDEGVAWIRNIGGGRKKTLRLT